MRGQMDRDGAGQGYARAEVGWMDQDAVGLLVPWGHLLTRTLVPFGAVGYCYFRKGGSFPVSHTRKTPHSHLLRHGGPGGQVTVLAVVLECTWGTHAGGLERRTGGRAGRQAGKGRGKVLAKSPGTDWGVVREREE